MIIPEIFYPSWSQKFSPLAPPPPRRQIPGRAHLVVAGNKEKQRKARPCAVCNPLSPSPLSLLSSSSGSSAHGAVGVLAPHVGLVWRNPHHIASRADRRRRCQDYFPLFPLVNSSFGNNENSAIARKCAWAVRSRYNRVPLYWNLNISRNSKRCWSLEVSLRNNIIKKRALTPLWDISSLFEKWHGRLVCCSKHRMLFAFFDCYVFPLLVSPWSLLDLTLSSVCFCEPPPHTHTHTHPTLFFSFSFFFFSAVLLWFPFSWSLFSKCGLWKNSFDDLPEPLPGSLGRCSPRTHYNARRLAAPTQQYWTTTGDSLFGFPPYVAIFIRFLSAI